MKEIELRKLSEVDAPDLFNLVDNNRDQLAGFYWEQSTRQVEDSRRFIRAVNVHEDSNGAPTRGIYLDEALVGVAALHTIDWSRRHSVLGYWLGKEQSGKGYAALAARGLVQMGFETLRLDELQIQTSVDNTSCRRIAVKNEFQLAEVKEDALWEPANSQPMPTAVYQLQRTKS